MNQSQWISVVPLLACLAVSACGGGGGGASASSAAAGNLATGLGASSSSGTGNTGLLSASATAGALALQVRGNNFVNGAGQTVQLRGVNLSGLEFVAVQGWSPANPWGGQTGTGTPDWAAVKSWKSNVVRIPLNEASWLGLHCVDYGAMRGTAGLSYAADPGGNYQATVKSAVDGATAAGLYVILDLHWTAPGNACPMAQNPLPDMDHSLAFWTQMANLYKGYPNVAFEAFNEPFLYYLTGTETALGVLRNGGQLSQFVTGGAPYTVSTNWNAAGMQQIVDAIRATGATNVILAASPSYTQDLSGWLANRPTDPLGQLAATWHAYPSYGTTFGTAAYTLPNFGQASYTSAANIMAAGYPVLITEYGDHDTPGTTSAPFASALLPQADALGIGYLGWCWDVFLTTDNVLIADGTGTPTAGYGQYVRQHYLCRATGASNCV